MPPIFGRCRAPAASTPTRCARTFNMGIGMVVVVPAEAADVVTEAAGLPVHRIGTVVEQSAPERVVLR